MARDVKHSTRRDLLRKAGAAGVGATAGLVSGVIETIPLRAAQPPAVNSPVDNESRIDSRITRENALQGATDWQLTRVRPEPPDGVRCPAIEGFCTRQSVKVGDTLGICFSTAPAKAFKLEIFRTGYYGGRGARLMKTIPSLQGQQRQTPQRAGKQLRECRWKPSVELKIPSDWISGVYVGRLTTESDDTGFGYWQSYVVFIVKDDRPADVLFQCSDNTWQAYNEWPLRDSVYTHPKGNQGPWADVSFDRPYGKYPQIFENPQTIGSGEWLCFEYPMAYWLEKHGYDVSYCSNSDMLTPERGLKCKAFLSVGHDEYWDSRQYRSVTKMRDEGVSLLFLSGNSVCWVSPFRSSEDGRENRILFRGGPYGGDYKWAELRETQHGPFPHRGPDEGYLMGARNVDPVNGGGDWICTLPDHWLYEGTGMKLGDTIPGLLGWASHGHPHDAWKGLLDRAEGHAPADGGNTEDRTSTV